MKSKMFTETIDQIRAFLDAFDTLQPRVGDVSAMYGVGGDQADSLYQVATSVDILRHSIETDLHGLVFVDAAGDQVLYNQEAAPFISGDGINTDFCPGENSEAVAIHPDGSFYSQDEYPIYRAFNWGEHVLPELANFRYRSGATKTYLTMSAPRYKAQGVFSGAVGTYIDVSHIEKINAALKLLMETASELKPYLLSIKGAVAALHQKNKFVDPREIREVCGVVANQVEVALEILQNASNLCRMRSDHFPLTPKPVRLDKVLSDARYNISRSGDLDVRLDLPPELPVIIADSERVAHAIGNVMSYIARRQPSARPIVVTAMTGPTHVTVHIGSAGAPSVQERPDAPTGLPSDGFEYVDAGGDYDTSLALTAMLIKGNGGRLMIGRSRGPEFAPKFAITIPIASEAGRHALVSSGSDPAQQFSFSPPNVVIVSDKPEYLKRLKAILSGRGYPVVLVDSLRDVPRTVELNDPTLVVIDLVFPTARVRETLASIEALPNATAVLAIGALQTDAARALSDDIDDYLAEPFTPVEFLDCVELIVYQQTPRSSQASRKFELDDLFIDFDNFEVKIQGKKIELTSKEFQALRLLAVNSGKVLTYDFLLSEIWGPHYRGDLHTVRALVSSLRRKLEDGADKPPYIVNIRQAGYRMKSAS